MNKQDSILSDNDPSQPILDIAPDKQTSKFDGLNNTKIYAYGVGHFINDLVAACWFNYLLYFLKTVVSTPAAAYALLAGQIADGIATPVVGFLSDKYSTRIGQRTPWYILGLVLVSGCFIPIFQKFKSQTLGYEYAYYIIFPSLFNFGWAALQISHMSLVPSLSCSRKRRDKLNNFRNSFTFIANYSVLAMGLIIFKVMNNPALEYALISYITLGLGLITSSFFLYQIREVELTQICVQKSQILREEINLRKASLNKQIKSQTQFSDDEQGQVMYSTKRLVTKVDSIFDWFKMPKFYLFGFCYMGVRLYVNVFGTFLPFYLVGVLRLGHSEDDSIPFTVALVPLIIYTTSVTTSSLLNKFYNKFGRKMALMVGCIICIACLCSLFILDQDINWVIYILAGFIGVSQTMVLSTGINFISDVVGTKAKTGAFVFGIYSLLDKFSAGAVIFVLGNSEAYTVKPNNLSDEQKTFIKLTFILIPLIACVLATAIVLAYPVKQYNSNKKSFEGSKKTQDQRELVE